MKVPISWLKDYVDITIPIEELAERLTLAGMEVEHIEYYGVPGAELTWDHEKIVTAQISWCWPMWTMAVLRRIKW
jgi:phenylalanyl-tRNA synthetase beta chain